MEKLKAEGQKPFLSWQHADILHYRENPPFSTVTCRVSSRTNGDSASSVGDPRPRTLDARCQAPTRHVQALVFCFCAASVRL